MLTVTNNMASFLFYPMASDFGIFSAVTSPCLNEGFWLQSLFENHHYVQRRLIMRKLFFKSSIL